MPEERIATPTVLTYVHPRRLACALNTLDNTFPSYSLSRADALRRTTQTLVTVTLCLLFLHYAKYFVVMEGLLRGIAEWHGREANVYVEALRQSGWRDLAGYAWWASCHLISLIAVPFALIKWQFHGRIREYGWHWNETTQQGVPYALLLLIGLFFVSLGSQREDFTRYYPFYVHAGRSWFDLLAWEILYLSQFVAAEFFFRGFILHALRPALGVNAIVIMCVPYMMIHLPKLWLESVGSIPFGLILGFLALQTRSIWGAVIVHVSIALGMDIGALLQRGELPIRFWPQ